MSNALLSRRQFLSKTFAGAALLALSPSLLKTAQASLSATSRKLALLNLHTGERCALTFWEAGRYIPEALENLSHLLRDHRNDATHTIDPALFDLLAILHQSLGTNAEFEVISGYRSPESNAAMHARSSGVASHSLHMEGKAMDIRVPGRALTDVHRTALLLGLGGVGYYPTSNFVHVDTGRVRQWSGV